MQELNLTPIQYLGTLLALLLLMVILSHFKRTKFNTYTIPWHTFGTTSSHGHFKPF